MTTYELFRQCSHTAPDECRKCNGDGRDEAMAARMTPADRARVAAENARVAPLVAAAWAVPVGEDIRRAREYARVVAEQRREAVASDPVARRAWLETFNPEWRPELARRLDEAYGKLGVTA